MQWCRCKAWRVDTTNSLKKHWADIYFHRAVKLSTTLPPSCQLCFPFFRNHWLLVVFDFSIRHTTWGRFSLILRWPGGGAPFTGQIRRPWRAGQRTRICVQKCYRNRTPGPGFGPPAFPIRSLDARRGTWPCSFPLRRRFTIVTSERPSRLARNFSGWFRGLHAANHNARMNECIAAPAGWLQMPGTFSTRSFSGFAGVAGRLWFHGNGFVGKIRRLL